MKTVNKKLSAVSKVEFLDQSRVVKNLSGQETNPYTFLKELQSTIRSGGENALEAAVEMRKFFNDYLSLGAKALHDKPIGDAVMKWGVGGNMPTTERLDTYFAMGNELTVDTNWMEAYSMIMTNALVSEVLDIDATQEAFKEYAMNDDIKLSDFGALTFSKIEPRRWAFGKGMNRLIFERDQIWNINLIMQKFLTASLTTKANTMYGALNAGTAATTTSAGATVAQRIAALDSAYLDLITRLAGNGFNVSTSTQAVLFTRANHLGLISQVMNTGIGADTNNLVSSWKSNIKVVPTLNTNLDILVGGTPAGFLFVPGLKNKFVTHEAMRTEESMNFKSDSLTVLAQEYWNHNTDSQQGQKIDWA